MKKIILLVFTVFGIFACKDSKNTLIPEPEVVQSIYPFDTTRYDTKEPYITLEDKGLEAFLVINGQDTDNQVNGKISKQDADKIESLNLSLIDNNNILENKYMYVGNLYSLLDQSNKAIGNQLPKLPVKSIDDLKKFVNIRQLVAGFLEGIEVLDLNDCPKIKFVNMHYTENLKITGSLIDSSSNISIAISGVKYFQKEDSLNQSKLDLSELKFVNTVNINSISNIELPMSILGLRISRSNYDGTKLNDYLDIKLIDLDELPRVKSLKLVSNHISLHLNNCKNLEEINFDNVNNISELVVGNSPLITLLDLSRFKNMILIFSGGNLKLDTIIINKEQKLIPDPSDNWSRFIKDPWTVWKVK